MNFHDNFTRTALCLVALAGALGCGAGTDLSPRREAPLAAVRGCGASAEPATRPAAPSPAPPVVGMCR